MNLPKEVRDIVEKFSKAGFQIYIVGGAVRDLLINRKVKDWDFTTDAKPEDILKLFPEGFYDNKFGTVGIPVKEEGRAKVSRVSRLSEAGELRSESTSSNVHEKERAGSEQSEEAELEKRDEASKNNIPKIYEITTMRKEGKYQDHRHPLKISWTNKIKEDLARRDFTINAMALKISNLKPQISNLEVIDPFNGQKDLHAKLIRAVGDPDKRFQEDALRLIRAIRIGAELDFEIEQETFKALKKNSHLIGDIANERIRDELFKLFASNNPYNGLIKLREAGILQIILPELEACFGIVQEGPKHDRIYDIGDHSFRTMRETPTSDPLVKFAALLHDVGKAPTFKKDEKGNVTFYNHETVGANLSLQIAKRLNLSKKQTDKLYRLIRWHMFSTDEHQTDSAIRRFLRNVGLENVEDIMKLRIGDRLGGDTSKPISWRMEQFQERIKEVLKKPFSITDLKVNGNDVMKVLKIKPGRKVGEVLEKLFQEVLEDANKNTREFLLQRIKNLE